MKRILKKEGNMADEGGFCFVETSFHSRYSIPTLLTRESYLATTYIWRRVIRSIKIQFEQVAMKPLETFSIISFVVIWVQGALRSN